ncbi:MAG: hypothetical protein JSS98_12010 [Bacteroidetes bacterium]|nr:hypothetical protein [Bacteroidota bacterium]
MKNKVIAAITGSLVFGVLFIVIASIFRAINISRYGRGGFSNILLEGLILSAVFFIIIILFLKFGKKRN